MLGRSVAIAAPPSQHAASVPAAPALRRSRPLVQRRGAGLVLLGLGILALTTLVALGAPLIASADPGRVSPIDRLKPPAWLPGGSPVHLLGTDQLGRDLFARLVYGARVSLLIGTVAVLGSGLLGVALGLVAGYYRGRTDAIVMRVADIQQAFPYLALAIAVVGVLGASLQNLMIVLAVTGWILYARVVRAEVLSLREKEYIEAARALGCSDARIMLRHVLPNVISPVIVVATFSFATMIIAEASLTFLGLGVDPTVPSWGTMLSDSRNYLQVAWWYPTFPGLALMLVVVGANLMGDGLRDMWDPRIQIG